MILINRLYVRVYFGGTCRLDYFVYFYLGYYIADDVTDILICLFLHRMAEGVILIYNNA